MWSCYDNSTQGGRDPSWRKGKMYEYNLNITDCNCNGPCVYANQHAPFTVLGAGQQQALLRQFANATIFFNEGPLNHKPLWLEELQYVSGAVL